MSLSQVQEVLGLSISPLESRIQNLEEIAGQDVNGSKIDALQQRIDSLEAHLAWIGESASYDEVVSAVGQVTSVTEEIFGPELAMHHVEDSEVPGCRYFEVIVQHPADIDAIVAKQDQWHSRVSELPFNVRRLFALSVDPV